LVVDDRVVGVETISEDEKNFFDSFILSEQIRVANEQKRIEAYNNIDIDLKEDTDYFTVSVTKKDGTKEDVMIAKGKNSVSPAYISKKIDKDATDEFVPSAKAVLDFSGITNTKSNSFESIEAPLKNLKAYGTKKGNSKINLFKKNIFDIGTDVSGYFSSNTNGSKIITSVGTVSKNIDLSFSNDSILVNNYNVTGYYWLSKFVELTPNTDYTLSANNNMGGVRIYGADSNSENTVGTQIGNMYDNYNEVTFNSGEYKYYWISFFPKEAGQKLEKCQLEVGIKATEFESYQGKQTLTFTDTLYRVGDIKDEKDYSKGIKIKRVNAATISSLGTLSVVTLANGGKGLVVTPSDKKSAISGAVCTNAEYERGTLSYLDGTFYENKLNFVFCGTSSDTLETLTAKYGSAVLTYVIATEVETPIPEAELSAYRQLHTYEGVTTIVGDAEVEYFGCNPNGKFASDLQSQINDLDLEEQVKETITKFKTEVLEDVSVLEDEFSTLSQELAVERTRITNLATLEDGSTTGDAELIDARIGEDGVTYGNLGSAIREQFKKKIGIMSTLPTGTDLNTITKSGCYFIATDCVYSNLPEGQNVIGGMLIVVYERDSRNYQIFVSYNGNDIYTRNYIFGGGWREWHQVIGESRKDFNLKTNNSIDLNDYKDSGFYHLGTLTSGNYGNIPDGENNGLLCVFGGYSDEYYPARMYQLFIGRQQGKIWFRFRHTLDKWNEWITISSDGKRWDEHKISGEVDVNTLTQSGYYFVPSGVNIQNLPEENVGGMLQVFYSTPTRFYQTYFSFKGDAVYYRNFNGTKWNDWKKTNEGISVSGNTVTSPYVVKKVSNTQFYIYRVCAGGMIRYKYHRNQQSSINLDTWQMGEIYLCDTNGSPLKRISADGYDNEGVLILRGESDFIGGIHGDEIFTDLCIFINGKQYTPENIPNTSAEEIRILVKSNITHADTTNVCMTKTKQTTFDVTGVHVNNRWKLLEDLSVGRVRAILLSVDKTCVNKYYDSNVHTFPVDIPTSGGTWKDNNITDTYYQGDISAHVWCGVRGGDQSLYNTEIADFESRMKSYFDCYVNYDAKSGEELYCQNNFNIMC
jgi:hypothetical protein